MPTAAKIIQVRRDSWNLVEWIRKETDKDRISYLLWLALSGAEQRDRDASLLVKLLARLGRVWLAITDLRSTAFNILQKKAIQSMNSIDSSLEKTISMACSFILRTHRCRPGLKVFQILQVMATHTSKLSLIRMRRDLRDLHDRYSALLSDYRWRSIEFSKMAILGIISVEEWKRLEKFTWERATQFFIAVIRTLHTNSTENAVIQGFSSMINLL